MTPTSARWWLVATAAVGAAAVAGVLSAPPDVVQGDAQRLMYLHVPAAWSAFLCFFVVLVAGVHHLASGSEGSDRLGRAAAEVGVVLTGLTLLLGSVWGTLVWGTGWAWDARVTTTVAMGLVYLGCLAARGAVGGARGRRVAAALGTVGFAVVPLVHFSVVWWPTLHQPATVLAPSLSPPLDPRMGLALATALLAFTMLTAWAVSRRVLALRTAATGIPAPSPERQSVAS